MFDRRLSPGYIDDRGIVQAGSRIDDCLRKKTSTASISRASGPAQDRMNFIPGVLQLRPPPFGIRDALGRNPYVPQHRAGIRIEPGLLTTSCRPGAFLPAISVPTPRGDPLMAIRAPSPPLDPPGPRIVLWGFNVRPKTLLCESAVYGRKWLVIIHPRLVRRRTIIVWGIFVLT